MTKTDTATTPNNIATRRMLHPYARLNCVRTLNLYFIRRNNARYAYHFYDHYAKGAALAPRMTYDGHTTVIPYDV